ncbi:MAG TPA: rhodanese-like domain-containing protein [Vicinamibacterales bacterium]|nr:rhodanese-like domain-containing protein [Vicinamibacterales bacterium]
MPKHVSVTEAHALQQQGGTYVDVRSRAEYEAGHAEGALNVPLAERTGPNPDFIHVMKALFAPDAKLLIGCQVGGRSMRAAGMLESFGFSDVSNIKGGFAGMRDPMGRSIDPGWEESGLPVETGAPAGRRYEDLAAKAGIDE